MIFYGSCRYFILYLLISMMLINGFAQYQIQKLPNASTHSRSIRYLSPEKLKIAIPASFHRVAADLYWLRYIQDYVSETSTRDNNLQLTRIITTLSPTLRAVYEFCALRIAHQSRDNIGQPELAVNILTQGIRYNPVYWPFYLYRSQIYAGVLHDFPRAAASFAEVLKRPQAPAMLGQYLILYALTLRDYSLFQQVLDWQKQQFLTKEETTEWQLNQRWLTSVFERTQLIQWLNAYEHIMDNSPPSIWPNSFIWPWLTSFALTDPYQYPYLYLTRHIQINPFSPLYYRDLLYQSLYISPEKLAKLRKQEYWRHKTGWKPPKG